MTKDILYVIAQFVLFALYLIGWDFSALSFPSFIEYSALVFCILGGFVILFGILHLNNNITAFPSPKEDSVLISRGIYKYVRHPIYSGILLAMFSYALFSESTSRLIISFLLLIVFYFKSEYEEKLLIQRYEQYKTYREQTGRFVPRRIK